MREKLKKLNEPSRRNFIATAAAGYLGVNIVGNGTRGWAKTPTSSAKAQSVIFIYMSGGMTHLDTFDPKPGTPEQGPVKAIKTNVKGIQIGEYLPKLAKHMDKMALIRSMNSREGSHERGTYLVHTGYAPLGGVLHPAVGAWSLRLAGALNKTIPNYVVVGGRNATSSGFMGPSYSPAIIGDPLKGLQNVQRPSHIADVDYAKTLNLIEEMDSDFRKRYRSKTITAYNEFYEKAISLMASEDVKAFDVTMEDEATRKSYGDNFFGRGLLLGRRLVESGVRFVEVNLGGWDMHNNHQQALQGKLPDVDTGISALLTDLENRGLLDSTLVVLATEFGRTPKISQRNGRDHWSKAWSTFMAGGGVRGGQVYGGTDKGGYKVTRDGVTPPDFNATIAHALGVKYDLIIYDDSSGRPFRMGGLKGNPVTAIF